MVSISGCGGDSDTELPIEGEDSTPVEGSSDPLLSSAGAADGLPGCFNRNLYTGGPHLVSTRSTLSGSGSTETQSVDLLYTALEAEDGDDPIVELQSTVTFSSGASFTFTDAYTLDGNVLTNIGRVGNAGLSPDPDGQEWFFGLEPLEEGNSTALVDNGARSSVDGSILYDDVSNTQIYIGNETLDTPMGAFETCRMITRLLDGTAESTSWYAVGSGVVVRKHNVLFRTETDLGPLESTTQLEIASINGVSIAP